jgi:hypothetical protein
MGWGIIVLLKIIQRPELHLLTEYIPPNPIRKEFFELICGMFVRWKGEDVVELL